ncbi:MAG: peptidoglycan/LPS O-acetylase OafA/YrhL [Planctomycetota bacterium]|jgi:peptidoglycan/LPS O-acetylase OafA/YrhL
MWEHIPLNLDNKVEGTIRLIVQPGYLGVDLFFVLSGFLITRILLVDKEQGVPLRFFLMRRLLRIFPIYYLTLFVVFLWRGGPELVWCAAYLSNFWLAFNSIATPLGHTWSLAVEEHYYLLWPLAVYLLSRRKSFLLASVVLIPVAIAAGFYANYYFAPNYQLKNVSAARDFIQYGTVFRMLSLSLGAVLAYCETALRKSGWRTLLLALTIGIGGYYFVWYSGFHPLFGAPNRAWLPAAWLVGFSAISTGWVLLALSLHLIGHGPQRLLSNAPLRAIGRISYGLYLYHYPIYFALDLPKYRGGQGAPVSLLLLAVGLTFLTATISYQFIERPILRIQQRYRAKA